MRFSRRRALMPAAAPHRITIVSASVGAGHDGAAAELTRRLQARGFGVDRYDFLDLLPFRLGRLLRRMYALQLRAAPGSWGFLLDAVERWAVMEVAVRGLARLAARRTAAVAGPDTVAVVSTYPLASQALGGMRAQASLRVPVFTYLTDLSVHPLWVADGVDAHVALHPVAAAQAQRLGARDVQVTAPAVAPAFRAAESALERHAARLAFGLPPDRPLALVVAGSWGVGEVGQTARDIAAHTPAVPVVVCGHNAGLRQAIERRGDGIALGWVDDMPALLRACDVVVQNAGGLSCLEAMATGLPVISYRCLPGHGQTNAAALEEAGWAPWIHRPEDLPDALHAALHPSDGAAGPLPAAGIRLGPDPSAIIADLVCDRAGIRIPRPLKPPAGRDLRSPETMPSALGAR
ncbi:hypothetical protein Pth03_38460 [Planotetraspora thailandica]|uniref:Diacylglycerol glucosyltransferase N-terminal domain-containing protein n=1 Tax=Planotetraspora thailandica TaxID=487172 RepID=A0A8J3V1B1_9ACTN|nr:glycosyltransferase [Planotetraspora thailandica]GII55457.1 hypothetical protein Pth03_38460 [Planotetraspora thailandica]